jgi:hypothetical protein
MGRRREPGASLAEALGGRERLGDRDEAHSLLKY